MKGNTIKKKKILAAVMTAILAVSSLTACGNSQGKPAANEVSSEDASAESDVAKETSTAQENAETAAGDDGSVREELTALEVTKHYMPWSYCGTESGENWGTVSQYEEQNTYLEKLTRFTKQGYGVIIGEYAVIPAEQGTIKQNTKEYV